MPESFIPVTVAQSTSVEVLPDWTITIRFTNPPTSEDRRQHFHFSIIDAIGATVEHVNSASESELQATKRRLEIAELNREVPSNL